MNCCCVRKASHNTEMNRMTRALVPDESPRWDDGVINLVMSPCERTDDFDSVVIRPTPSTPSARKPNVFINLFLSGDSECSSPTMYQDTNEQMLHVRIPANADVYLNYEKISDSCHGWPFENKGLHPEHDRSVHRSRRDMNETSDGSFSR